MGGKLFHGVRGARGLIVAAVATAALCGAAVGAIASGDGALGTPGEVDDEVVQEAGHLGLDPALLAAVALELEPTDPRSLARALRLEIDERQSVVAALTVLVAGEESASAWLDERPDMLADAAAIPNPGTRATVQRILSRRQALAGS
jgi:hypothetical protein